MINQVEFKRAVNLLAMRFPDAIKDPAGAALFIHDCNRLGLDPLIQPAEAVPVKFKTKDKNGREKHTVAMVLTEDGSLSMAARGCPEEYQGAPATMPLIDYLMREHEGRPLEELDEIARRTAESLCADRDAFVWVALGRRRSAIDINPVYGYYTQVEYNNARSAGLPAGKQPGNQARVRAVKRWVRENFPEARQRMLSYTAELNERSSGALEAAEFIDSEYRVLLDNSPKVIDSGKTENKPAATTKPPQLKDKPAESSTIIQGDGFNIKVDWLEKVMKAIKWTDDTAISFIHNKWPEVDSEGSLYEVIKRLDRTQADEFTSELQRRAEDPALKQLF